MIIMRYHMLIDVEDLHREDTGNMERSGVIPNQFIAGGTLRARLVGFFVRSMPGLLLECRSARAAQLTDNSLGRCGVNRDC